MAQPGSRAATAQIRVPTRPYPSLRPAPARALLDEDSDALARFEQALRLSPAEAAPLRELGQVLLRMERWEEAEDCFDHLLALNPADVSARLDLGRARRGGGRLQQAAAAFEDVSRQVPTDPVAPVELARTLLELGDPAAGLRRLGRLRGEASDALEVLVLQGQCALAAGDLDLAERSFQRAVAISREVGSDQPALHAQALAGLGRILVRLGEPSLAEDALMAATGLASVPSLLVARAEMAIAIGRAEVMVDELQARLSAPLPVAERAELCFLLGNLLDRAGRPEEAILSWLEANHLAPRHFDAERFEAGIEAVEATFSQRAIDALPRSTPASEAVIVVGQAGCGAGLLTWLLRHHRQVLSPPPGDPAEVLLEVLPRYTGRPWPECAATLQSADLHHLVQRLLRPASLVHTDAPARVVYSAGPRGLLHLGLLSQALPQATVVLIERNPWDAGLSLFRRPLRGPGLEQASDLGDIAHAWTHERRLVEHWDKVLPLPIIRVRYEALATHPRATMDTLARQLRLPPFPSSLPLEDRVHTRGVERWPAYARWLGPLGELKE